MKFVDTNYLIDNINNIDTPFCLSSITLEEVENIKTSRNKDEDTKYKARRTSDWLVNNTDKYEVITHDYINYATSHYPDKPDYRICWDACQINDCEFYTKDYNCWLIAKNIFELNVAPINIVKKNNIYMGYKEICGNTDYINSYVENIDFDEWSINEYLIINNTDDNTSKEMRFDGEKFVALKLPSSKYIKGKNSLQRCALDILNNPEITIAAILGGYGSGKTFLSMRMALYSVNEKGWQSKILGIREPVGEGHEIGYLPGDINSKTDNFFLPLVQQLDGGEYELEMLKQRGVIESNVPYFLKGTSYANTVILVDEAEDLTEKQIKLIGTRLAENSRIILDGDYKQAIYNSTESNALVKMCNEFKNNKNFACIYLGEDVRSEASKMFANLFND